MNVLGIIPARYSSTRFPGKPLIDIKGKSMVRRVYEQASESTLDKIIVATDDQRIFEHVKSWGGAVVMTAENHPSGTDRISEALEVSGEPADYVVNIQGDEPFIEPDQINSLIELLDGKTSIATLIKKIDNPDDLTNPNIVKVVHGDGRALYFSRSPIPYFRGSSIEQWTKHHDYYRHIGIYAYKGDVLKEITKLPQGNLEKAESLEQLRWLENGYSIAVKQTDHENYGIDTPEDLNDLLGRL